jgi:hypothetical protein
MDLKGFNQPAFNLAQEDELRKQLAKRMSQKKSGGFEPSALIAEGGGLGGALAGGAAGAAVGSVVPGIGTLIGGLIGAGIGGFAGGTGGSVAEQKVRDGKVDTGKALKFGAIEGITSAGPIKLAKGATAAGKALAKGMGAKGAKEQAEKAISNTLLSKLNKGVSKSDIPAKMYAQAFTVPRRSASTLKPQQTARELIDYGVSGSVDKIKSTSDNVLKNVGGLFDRAVTGVGGDVRIGDPVQVAKQAIQGVKIPKPDLDVLMQRVTDIGTSSSMPGYSNPSMLLDKIRDLERYGYSRINAANSSLVKNPDMADLGSAYVQVAKELEDNLYTAIDKVGSLKGLQTPETAAQLNSIAKGLGDKFVNAQSAQEVRSLMSPFVRARNLANSTLEESQSAGSQGLGMLAGRGVGAAGGFALGGIPGAAAGFLGAPLLRGAEEAVRAPISTATGSLLNKMGSAAGRASNPMPQPVGTAGRALAGAGVANATLNSSAAPEDPLLSQMNQGPEALPAGQGGLLGGMQPGQDATSSLLGLPEQEAQPTPGSAEWYMAGAQQAAMAGDMESAQQFMEMAGTVSEMSAGPDLSNAQQKGVLAMDNAMSQVDQLEQLFGQAGGGQGRIAGAGQGLLGKVGLNANAKAYRDKRAGAAVIIARALGEAGTMTEGDIQRAVSQIPDITDTSEEAQIKWSSIKQLLAQIGQNTLSAPSSSGGSDLLSQMQMSGAF